MLPKKAFQEEIRLLREAAKGDEQALTDLLVRYETLLIGLAWQLSRQTRQPEFFFDEFYQAIRIGFIEAVTQGNFDPQRRIPFWGYASTFALNEIKKVRRQHNLVQLSATATRWWNQIKQSDYRIRAELQREPTPEEIAEDLGLDVFYVHEVLQANTRYERLSGDGDSAGTLLDEGQLQQALEAPLNPPRQEDLLRHRQWLLAMAERRAGHDAAIAWMILEILYRDLARDRDRTIEYEGEAEAKPDRHFWESIASDLSNPDAQIGQLSGEDGIPAWEILCQGYPEAMPRSWVAVCALFARDDLPRVTADNLKRWRSRIRSRIMPVIFNSLLLLEDIEDPASRYFKPSLATAFDTRSQTTTREEANREALEALNEVYQECLEDNWDGYGASAVSEKTYLESQRFLQLLPGIFPRPEITVDPDGEIAFDWDKGSREKLSVSVSSDHLLTYAGLYDINKAHGTEYFGEDLPATILSNLQRLFYKNSL